MSNPGNSTDNRMRCFECGSYDHKVADCPDRKSRKKQVIDTAVGAIFDVLEEQERKVLLA